jgi:simple sugar transport system permease protein
MIDSVFAASLIAASLRLAVPLVLNAEGEVIAERAGVLNIGIEGIALLGAFAATYASGLTKSPWIGILLALVVGVIAGSVQALISLHPKGDQILGGIGLNVFATGITAFGLITVWGEFFAGASPSVPKTPKINLPFTGAFSELSLFVPLMFLMPLVVHYILFRTRAGLRLRAVGENPAAADAAGINVNKTRFIAVVIGAAFAALSGAYLSIDQQGRFLRYMQTGGFTAIAIVVFGSWKPMLVLAGGLLFGLGEALVSRIAPALGIGIAPQFLQMVPALLTIVIFSVRRKTIAPEALGVTYVKE